MNETRDHSRVITDVTGGTTSCDVENMSLISSLFGLGPATGESPGFSTSLHTITEEPDKFLDSSILNTSSYNAGQTSPQILKYVIQQAKTILVMDTFIKSVMANGFQPSPAFDASTADVNSSQSGVQQMLDPNAELNELQNLYGNMSINGQTQQQSVSSEPPLIPPMPKHTNFIELTGSHGTEYKTIMPRINDNDYVQDNINVDANFEIHDMNMNFERNPFNYSTYSSAPMLAPRLYESAYESPFINDNQPRTDSAATNNLMYSAAPIFAPQTPVTAYDQNKLSSVVSQDSQFRAPTSLPTTRGTFEHSLKQSAKSFFERLEANSQSKNRETNPFKVDVENDKFHYKNWSPVTSSLSSRSPMKNAFVPERDAIPQEKTSPRRVVYEAGPVMYNSSSKNKPQRKRDSPAPCVQSEREAFEASKEFNVAYWIDQGCSSNANYVNNHESVGEISSAKLCDRSYACNFTSYNVTPSVPVNVRMNNIPPPIPPRPRAPRTKSEIESEVCKVPDANVQGTSNPVTRYIESDWIQAAENAMSFKLKGSLTQSAEACEGRVRQDIAAGGPVMVKIEREHAPKRAGIVKREDAISREEVTVKREVEAARTGETWDFTAVQLTKQIVYVIHLDNEGWLTIEEVLAAFTDYKTPEVILKILDIQNAQIPFRFIQRSDYPRLFEQLERTSLAVPRNHNNRIGDFLHLTPIKSILKILRKLKIVDLKDVELATKKRVFPKNSSALFDVCTVVTIYANRQAHLPSS